MLRRESRAPRGRHRLAGAIGRAGAARPPLKYLGLYSVPARRWSPALQAPRSSATLARPAIYGLARRCGDGAELRPTGGAHGQPAVPVLPRTVRPESVGGAGVSRPARRRPARRGGHRSVGRRLPPGARWRTAAFSPVFALGVPVVVAACGGGRRWPPSPASPPATSPWRPSTRTTCWRIAPIWCVAIGASAGVLVGLSPSRSRGALRDRGGPGGVGRWLRGRPRPRPRAAAGRRRRARPPADRERPLYTAVQFSKGTAPGAVVYAVGAENMVDDRLGPLLGDHNGPVSHARMQARVAGRHGVAAALEEMAPATSWCAKTARSGPSGRAATRGSSPSRRRARARLPVSPAAPPARDSAGPPPRD